MSGSVNKVILIGNLGRDPEVRTMSNGGRLANLSVATSERWKDRQSGEQREKTEWHRVVIFDDKLVDVAERFLNKGSKVYLEGQLQDPQVAGPVGPGPLFDGSGAATLPQPAHHARFPAARAAAVAVATGMIPAAVVVATATILAAAAIWAAPVRPRTSTMKSRFRCDFQRPSPRLSPFVLRQAQDTEAQGEASSGLGRGFHRIRGRPSC